MAHIDLSRKIIQTMGEMDKVIVDMRVTQMLRARRDEILDAIGGRTCEPTNELLEELAQLDQALGIEPLRFDEQDELCQLITELHARGAFDDLAPTSVDTDGCAL